MEGAGVPLATTTTTHEVVRDYKRGSATRYRERGRERERERERGDGTGTWA